MLTPVITDPIETYLLTEESSQWFPVGEHDSVVKNNYHEFDSEAKLQLCKSAVRVYLDRLFSTRAPDHWFSDNEFRYLFEELKHLIGETSTVQGNGGRSLTLGSGVILLAAASRDCPGEWLQSIHWTRLSDEVLPKQTRAQARAALTSLMDFFRRIAVSPTKRRSLIRRVNLSDRKLQVWLDLDSVSKNGGGASVIDQVISLPCPADGADNVWIYSAYRDFLIESTRNEDGGREARCVINLKPIPSDDGQISSRTLLELLACK